MVCKDNAHIRNGLDNTLGGGLLEGNLMAFGGDKEMQTWIQVDLRTL